MFSLQLKREVREIKQRMGEQDPLGGGRKNGKRTLEWLVKQHRSTGDSLERLEALLLQ